MVTLLGSAWYGRVELMNAKNDKASIAARNVEEGQFEEH